jgi:hypothetical protein
VMRCVVPCYSFAICLLRPLFAALLPHCVIFPSPSGRTAGALPILTAPLEMCVGGDEIYFLASRPAGATQPGPGRPHKGGA